MGPRASIVRNAVREAQASQRARWRRVYVRFVIHREVDGMRSRLGLFHAMDVAAEDGRAPAWASRFMHEQQGWFRDNLPRPDCFRESWPGGPDYEALCWFKPEAQGHIARMYDLKAGLEACDLLVDVLTTRDPGVIVYEDVHQVAARPGGRIF